MTGDYTKIPLRADERWTGTRMQQGRVLLDHEWNLNLDADARARADQVRDVIGAAGVAEGSPAFQVRSVSRNQDGTLDVTLGAGHMWVGGLQAFAPTTFSYSQQDQIPPLELPSEGSALVYLDVFTEHVQPAEDPGELVDPALAPIDSGARTRVGWRVRVATLPTTQSATSTCIDALTELQLVELSNATATISGTPVDPCAPPDPHGLIPDGLFRLEVLDSATASNPGRLAWSFDNGGSASAVATSSRGSTSITLAPSASVKFVVGDLVEVSWLARRADRRNHGPLYTVAAVTPGAGGDALTLDRPVEAPIGAAGQCVRRWDGQTTDVTSPQTATPRGAELEVRFHITATTLQVGDFWGSRLRQSGAELVENRTDAPPDGTRHWFSPLALIDLAGDPLQVPPVMPNTASDCRPTFTSLVGVATVSFPPTFVPSSDEPGWDFDGGDVVRPRDSNVHSFGGQLPVVLPHGVRIQSFRAVGSLSGDGELQVHLDRIALTADRTGPSIHEPIVSFILVSNPDGPFNIDVPVNSRVAPTGTIINRVDPRVAFARTDTARFMYTITARMAGLESPGNSARIRGFQITYGQMMRPQ